MKQSGATMDTIYIDDVERNSCDPESLLWNKYRRFVREHAVLIDTIDSALAQLLFLMPQQQENRRNSSSSHEVIYGLMALNRMAVDMAQQEHIQNSYGTSIGIRPAAFPATSMRILLTVTQSLLPTFLELFSNNNSTTRVRLLLERIKFFVRFSLLSSYWYQLWKENKADAAGLLTQGGMYYPHEEEEQPCSVEEYRSKHIRRQYVGRRTGRRITAAGGGAASASGSFWALILGELLYIYRPLYWARTEHLQYRPLMRHWMTAAGMDVMSYYLLLQHQNKNSREELRRRKMKLLLYLLRSPVWDRYTQRGVAGCVSRNLQNVPLLGRLADTYLWNWLLYWKHPFVSEEG